MGPKQDLTNSHSQDFSFPANISHGHNPIIQELGDPTDFIFFPILLPSCSKSRNFLPAPAEPSQPQALSLFADPASPHSFLLPIFFPSAIPSSLSSHSSDCTATLTINNRAAMRRKMDNKLALIGQECCQVSSCPFSSQAQPGSHSLSSRMLLLEVGSEDFGVIHTLGHD